MRKDPCDGIGAHTHSIFPLRGVGGLLLLSFLLLTGCPVGRSAASPAPPDSDQPVLPHVGAAIIANSLGESLSRYDLSTTPASLQINAGLTGQSPNELLIAGDRLLILNSLSNSVQIDDLATLNVRAEYSCGPRTNPWNVAAQGNTLWITCWASQEVIAMDLTDGTILQRLPCPSDLPHDDGVLSRPYPQGIAIDASGERIAVTLANLNTDFAAGGPGTVWKLALSGETATDAGLLILSAGRNAGDVTHTTVGGREAFVVASAGDFQPGTGYLGNGSFHLIDAPTWRELAAIPVASAPVKILAIGAHAYGAGAQAGDISQVDLGARTAGPVIQLPDSGTGLNYCSGLAAVDATHLLALEFNSDKLYGIDLSTGEVSGGLTVGDGPDAIVLVP